MNTKGYTIKKKLPLGGLAIASMGLNVAGQIGNLIGANKQAKKAELEAQKAYLNNTKEQDILELEDFEEQGVNMPGYYAKGGKLAVPLSHFKGGVAKPLSSDSVVMKGAKHEQGGIDLGNGVEVEGDETIKDGIRVFSDTLKTPTGKTYAEEQEKLARKKGELEKKLGTMDVIKNNTIKRQISQLDAKEDALFKEQESSKMESTDTKKLKAGGFASAVPFLDNVVNMGLTAMTPKVPKPTYLKPRKLNTNFNAQPQLTAVDDAVDNSTRFIEGNTSNSNAARNAITRTRLRGADSKAGIMANKENIENTLKNQDTLNRQRVETINASKTDQYNNMRTARKANMLGKISENFANLSDDVIDSRNFDETKRYNNEQLAAIKSMYNNGVVDRTDIVFQNQLRKLRGLPPLVSKLSIPTKPMVALSNI